LPYALCTLRPEFRLLNSQEKSVFVPADSNGRPAILGGSRLVVQGQARRWPILGYRDYAAVKRVLDRGVLSGRVAPEIKALEQEFAAFTGARICLATNSGTAALHMALAAAGVGSGDEVILPALTFIATAQAVLQQQAVPVFIDIDPKTYNLNPAEVSAQVTPRTKAIVAVHLHGLPADMDEINHIADRHGLMVIEDAAQAHGSKYQNRCVGTLADMAAFSLNSTKNLPAGEGGVFVTDSEDLGAKAARVRFNGLDPDPGWDPDRPLDGLRDSLASLHGSMYVPVELTAAVARAQLIGLAATTERSQRNGERLTRRLSRLAGIQPPFVPSDRTHVFHKYRVRLDPERAGVNLPPGTFRDCIVRALRAEGVEISLWQTRPLPDHPLFASRESYPQAAAVLDSTFIVGSQSYPLFAQPLAVVDQWAEAFEKIWAHLPELSGLKDVAR
jgi:dTDP-4-amino-4,6-dideoxygalactose transaminase